MIPTNLLLLVFLSFQAPVPGLGPAPTPIVLKAARLFDGKSDDPASRTEW